MSTEAKPPVEVEGLPLILPPHLTENFETAERQIREFYGLSPGVPALIRLWIACGTSSLIRKEFELAVLDIKRRGIDPGSDDISDDDSI